EEGIAGYVYLDTSCGAGPLYRLFSTITGDQITCIRLAVCRATLRVYFVFR
ncbi:hypothetical protein B0H19DRAFT_972179, partial [Mycena capillaripes]